MREVESFIDRLVVAAPRLGVLLKQHLSDNGELLPHVFMGDVTRLVSAPETLVPKQVEDWEEAKRIVSTIELALPHALPAVENLIAASFVENLDPDALGYSRVVGLFGPNLRRVLNRIKAGGL